MSMRLFITFVSVALLTLSPLSFSNDISSYDDEKTYTKIQLEEYNQNLNSLSNNAIKEKAISLIEEKNAIEKKIEDGEIDPNANSSSGYITRLKNIYSELSLIQKVLSGAGLFLLIDEIFSDDEAPRIPDITISGANVSESSGSASISIELSNPFNQEVTLNYFTADDSAESGSDYTESTGVIAFVPGEINKTLNIDILDNDIYEIEESFDINFTLANPLFGNLLNNTTSVTISDDDSAPNFGLTGAAVNEEDGTATLTITKTNSAQMSISVDYATADGSALAELDYVAVNDSVVFAANETEKTINVSIIDDNLDENEESFSISLTGASQGAVQESAAVVSIEDNDDAPSVRISGSNNVVEGDTLDINVTLAAESGKTVSINLQNTDVQAIAGLDYSTLNETVTFAPGETNKAVTVSIIDDDIDEVNEVFNVIALSPVNTVIASSESAPNGILNVLIEDNDDAPTINLSDDFSVSEDANTAVVEFNLSQVSGKRISFNYATQSTNQNASLFNAKSGVVNFEPGESSKSVTINLIDNNVYSGVDGEFILKISNASNAIIVDDTTKVTVVEDEAKPTLSISDVTVNEGDVATLTITQSGRTSADTTFIYKSSDGSATLANDDYETVSGLEVTIPAGLSVATFNINTNDDDVYEGNENLLIEIYQTSTPNLVDIGSGLEAEITIIDNDPLPSVSITDSLSSRTEGQGLALNFSKSGATELEVTFDLQISTIDAEADDYEVITSQISILPNETSLTNEVLRAIDDLVDEDDERLLISITNLQNAELGSITSHTLTIIDNDSPPILSLSNTNDISLVEGNSVSLNFVLSNTSEKPISFRYTTIAGTAVSGEEFEFNSEEITIPVGETSASVQINTLDDLVDETESKSFTVQISSLDNVTTELTEIPITVLDNDSAPLLSASITDITEGESATISFNLSSISEKVVTFDVASVSGSAISGTDFSLLSESITINPGSSSASVTLVTIDDAIDEVNETIGIQLSNLVNLLDETQTSYTLSVIDNDDAPVLVFSGRDINENVGTFDVLFSISEVSAKDIAFDVNSVADTASDADYNNISSTLTIPAGELSVSQSLTIIDDEIDEDNETFDITVSNLENVTATTLTEAFRIIDNDGVPNIIINNASITEGQSVEIPVNLSNVSELDIAIDYVTTDATAKAGTDYEASSGTLLISAGETAGVISIKTIDDQLDEEDKSLTLTLSNPQNATLSKSSIQVGIFDNDETPTVTAANKINEEGETVSISFALSEESGRDISFNYATNNGTAIAGIDYTSQSSSITFAAGESIKTINVVTLDDSLDEDRENFTVSLSNPTNVKLGTSVIEIALDDNDEEPTVSINGSNASEGSNSATAVISLSSASGKVITVDYLAFEANSAKAIEDFIPVSSSITFAPGEIQKTIAIDLVNDTIREASESFDISLGNIINAVASVNDTVSIVIEDDDLPPTIAITDASVLEDVGSINVTVSLSNVSSETISVDVDTLNGSAISGIDYTEYSNTLIFNPGETSKSVTLSILADTLDEFDESFNVVISNPSNASIANESAKVTIIDSDLAPAISLVAPVSINEGQNAEYAITLSKISAKDISFDYEVSGVSSNDVLVTSGSVNIPAGSQTASFVVTSLEDNLIEANEVIEISLNNEQNVQIGSSTYRTQLINTTVAKINISDVSVNESAGSASLTISLSATPDEKVEVDYKTSTQSTASALEDYTPVSGTLVFSAGETSKTIVIEILDDQLDESNEIITILLSTPVNAVIEDGSGSVEIVDNDITSIIINAGRYDESINPEIIVSLTSEETQTISLDYEFIGNTAVAGEDFVANSGTLTFNPGEISKFITLDLIDDGVRENDELITFRISNPVNASTPVTNTTITILDNDVDQAATINVLPAKEGEKLEIFISLDFAPEIAAEYDYFTRNNSAGDEDYIGKSGTIIFNPGETEKTIQIDIIDDDIKEESESFDFVLRHSVLGEQTKAINLRDNDSLNVSVLDGSADESAGEGLIEVNLSNPSASDTEVAYQIINKATGEIVDQNTINITAGKTSEFISLPIVDDELDEYDEEFEVLITNSNADYIDDGLAKFTVFDNDVTPTVSINSVNVAENIGTVDVTIELSAQSGRSILVGYTTEDDTALAGTEYYAKSGIFTFNPGDLTKTVTIPIIDNSLDEPNKSFRLTLGELENVDPGAEAIVTIEDDDEPPSVSFPVRTSVPENIGTSEIFYTLDRPSISDIVINYGVDIYQSAGEYDTSIEAGVITIPAGSTSASLSFEIIQDALDEEDEYFVINYLDVTGTDFDKLASAETVIEIIDDDFAPSLNIAPTASITEGQSGQIPVTLTGPSSQEIVVNYEIRDGPNNSALVNEDYQGATSGTITFTAGETTKSINISTLDDIFDEFDETLQVVLIDPVNAEIQNTVNVTTITDNDAEPAISIGDLLISENSASGQINLLLNTPSGKPITVSYKTEPATANSSDFYDISGSVIFAPGETSKELDVYLVSNDGVYEGNETFNYILENPVNATLANNSGTVTILNSDPLPSFKTLSNVTIDEGFGVFTFEVVLAETVSEQPIEIDYNIVDISAINGSDFVSQSSGSITIPALASSAIAEINITDDKLIESSESFRVEIGHDGNNAVPFAASFTVTISDNDTGPRFAEKSKTFNLNENSTQVVGSVSATDEDGDVLTYSIIGDDALAFIIDSSNGEITFKEAPDFETKSSYSITAVASDGVNEASQVITVTITNVNEAPTITSTTTAFTIAENQTAIPDATITATDVDADDTLTFSVSGDVLEIDANGVLSFATAPNFETTTSVTATVTVTDAAGLFDTQEVTVTVTTC